MGSRPAQEDPCQCRSSGRTAVFQVGEESLTCIFTFPSALGTESTCIIIIKVIYKARPLSPEGTLQIVKR